MNKVRKVLKPTKARIKFVNDSQSGQIVRALEVENELRHFASSSKAKILMRFFKTQKGEYGYGDRFLGVMVPQVRALAKKYNELSLEECEVLLGSPYNEARLLALCILVFQFKNGGPQDRQKIFNLYKQNLDRINNWNLVDSSAHEIVGGFLFDQSRSWLDNLLKSSNLWHRRVAILACLYFIRENQFEDIVRLCAKSHRDPEDLMHKACGWMLREVGKRDENVLIDYLEKNVAQMPRTMLRYSIERLPEKTRKRFMAIQPAQGTGRITARRK